MEPFKRILHKLLFPGMAVVIVSVPVAAALLIYTFLGEHEDAVCVFVLGMAVFMIVHSTKK